MLVRQIEQNLLFANQIDRDLLHIQANKLLNRRVDFCDLYLQSSLSESWALDEGIIKSGSFAIDQGVGVRAICYDKTFLNHSSQINESQLQQYLKQNYRSSQEFWQRTSQFSYGNESLNLIEIILPEFEEFFKSTNSNT